MSAYEVVDHLRRIKDESAERYPSMCNMCSKFTSIDIFRKYVYSSNSKDVKVRVQIK